MAFNVRFYTFSKKANSTAVPAAGSSYTSYNCVGKAPFSILSPVLQIKMANGAEDNPYTLNYAYIPQFRRYYYVTDWTNDGTLWYASLTVDALGSWKTSIGLQSCYVYRAASSYDTTIADNMYPTKSVKTKTNIALPKIFTVDGQNYAGDLPDTGYFVCNIVSSGGTFTYAMRESSFKALLNYLYSDTFYNAILTEFGATEYPEAKVAINPMQYITQVKWLPASVASLQAWAFQPEANAVSSLTIGGVVVSPSVPGGTFQAWKMAANNYSVYPVTMTGHRHPQASARGVWLNYAPYTQFEAFYPPFGIIQLDPVEIADYDTLYFHVTFDGKSCSIMLEIYVGDANGQIADRRRIYRNSACVAVDVPVSAVMTAGFSSVQMFTGLAGGAIGVVEGLLTGNANQFLSGINGAYNALGQAVNGRVPHVSASGNYGSTSNLSGPPALYITQWSLVDDDLADKGRPLCQTKTLSTLSGYIMADSDHISIACTSAELETIKSAVSSGFYYE